MFTLGCGAKRFIGRAGWLSSDILSARARWLNGESVGQPSSEDGGDDDRLCTVLVGVDVAGGEKAPTAGVGRNRVVPDAGGVLGMIGLALPVEGGGLSATTSVSRLSGDDGVVLADELFIE